MIKHVILWKLKAEYTSEQSEQIKAGIKEGLFYGGGFEQLGLQLEGLEGLKGQIPGLLEIKVNTNGLASSNVDVMLDSTFENEEALKNYAVHPAHVAVADGKVRPFTATRSCMDYEV